MTDLPLNSLIWKLHPDFIDFQIETKVNNSLKILSNHSIT